MSLNLKSWIFWKFKIPYFAILDRYIMNELISPFFFGLASFTIVYVSCGLFYQIGVLLTKGNASFVTVLLFVIYNIPQIMVYIFPMSILLASLLAFGRLSGDCEIIALKASGVSFYRLVFPVLIVASIVTSVALILNIIFVPFANFEARKLVFKTMAANMAERLSSNLVINDKDEDIERIIYAKKYNLKEGFMEDVTVTEYTGKVVLRTTYADKALWENTSWSLIDGKTYSYSADKNVESLISFKKTRMSLKKSPQDMAIVEKLPEEMTPWEIAKRIDDVRAFNGDYHWLEVQYNLKITLPFSCMVFALIGIPFAISPQRTSSSRGVGLALVIIFIYYTIMMTFTTLGNIGRVPAPVACWMPNIIFVGVAWHFISKASN